MREVRRFLGVELAGAKNDKTALASIDFYPKERKVFLLEVYERITPRDHQSADDALLELISELKITDTTIALDVPLTLPPCVACTRTQCATAKTCTQPAVKWMREFEKKRAKKRTHKNLKPSTPYTQRPVELWIRHEVLSKLELGDTIEVDEALGGTKAPLTARMTFLKRHLRGMNLLEVWPKVTVAILAEQLGIPPRIVRAHRHLEEGIQARTDFLTKIASEYELFIYDRDQKLIAQSLNVFDAFICAFTALLSAKGLTEKAPPGLNPEWGFVEYPELP